MIKDQDLLNLLLSDKTKELGFSKLVSEYKGRLYWHIRNIVKSHEDADDVLQDTFVKVYKNLSSFKGESKLFSWMYRIATNEALTFISRKSKMMQITNEEVMEFAVKNLQSDTFFDGDEAQFKLQKAIAKLPEKQQLVFNMKYFQEMKYKDMSEILDTSEGALKASYHIAVKKIEDDLEKN